MRKLAIILSIVPLTIAAQQVGRLQPGKVYEQGEPILAPTFGFKAVVPQNWSGVLPRESEVFLLSSSTLPAEIFVFGRKNGDLETMKKAWEKGVELDNGLSLVANSAIVKDGILSSEVTAVGKFIDKSKKGYAIAKCNEGGACITALAIMAAGVFEEIRKSADQFMLTSSFGEPSNLSPYADFDWKKFLSNKTLMTYAVIQGGSKETVIDLCADGTFTSSATKKGIFRSTNADYKGRLSGTWAAAGVGEMGELTLEFKKKLPALKTTLRIREEKIFANEERYYAAESTKCK